MPIEKTVLTVSQINEYIKGKIENDKLLTNIYVKGEISNLTRHKSGHLYFTLKDEKSNIKAVMFRNDASKLKFILENGMKVIAHGKISVFVRDGNCQLYVNSIDPDGIGALTIAFEQLKTKLKNEGLFDSSKKKSIPKIPTKIGIITSPTGAAVKDIINVAGRRFPYATLIIFPSLVQGNDAPAQLIAGIKYFNKAKTVDVIIIGRGGGSIEDLWAFNDENLARTIYASEIPVISSVGHEIDFTICDFVADLRAPTPSAAAELAVPETVELERKINNIISHMQLVIMKMISEKKQRVRHCTESRIMTNPESMLDQRKLLTVSYTNDITNSMKYICERNRTVLEKNAAKLDALSPLAVFSRGYSAVFSSGGKLIKNTKDVEIGELVSVQLSDGKLLGEIKGKESQKNV